MREILFICEHNSARSQIAEAYFNHSAAARLHAESAGLEPGTLNPYAVAVLGEEGLDIVGSHEEILAKTRVIRDRIRDKVLSFIREYDEKGLKLFIR